MSAKPQIRLDSTPLTWFVKMKRENYVYVLRTLLKYPLSYLVCTLYIRIVLYLRYRRARERSIHRNILPSDQQWVLLRVGCWWNHGKLRAVTWSSVADVSISVTFLIREEQLLLLWTEIVRYVYSTETLSSPFHHRRRTASFSLRRCWVHGFFTYM